MENFQYFEYLDLIYSALLSDNGAKSWHLVGTDKTYLQLKYLRESPTNNRDIGQVPYELIGTSGTSSWNQCWNQSEFQIPQFFCT